MNIILAFLAGGIGLLVTASAILMAWLAMQRHKNIRNQETSQGSLQQGISRQMLQWTFFDYALILVFAIGSLFLFTDVLAVIRDAQSYPLYHYGYLLCGFIFTLFGMLFMILRLSVVLSLIRSQCLFSPPNQNDHPRQAEQAEERIQSGEQRFKAELANQVAED
jgi:hypothetical protein